MKFCSMCGGSSIHTKSLNSSGVVTSSVISSRWLLVLNNVSKVLEKYAGKLIWSLSSSGSGISFNSHLLGCADADPSWKDESGSMSEERGGSGFLKLLAKCLCMILDFCLIFFFQNSLGRLWMKVNSSDSQHVAKPI